jgi:hypothetical protein
MSVSTKISIITNMCMKCNIVKMHVCIEYIDFPVLSSFMTNCRVCSKSYTTGATCRAETAHPSGAHEFIPGFSGIRTAQSLAFCVVVYRSLFVPVFALLFLLTIVLSVLRLTAWDYLFGIFKLLTIVLSVLLRLTAWDYLFGIFKLLTNVFSVLLRLVYASD